MDARTEHLIALVKDGARLGDAGRVYGISGERVRQILKGGGISPSELPGRGERRRGERLAIAPGLAPVIEAMWRAGMLSHEIAEVFDASCEAVHQLICERVSRADRSAQAAARRDDERAADERLLHGVRAAADLLASSAAIDPDDRRHACAAINGWLAARSQLSGSASAPSPAELTATAAPTSPSERLSPADLRGELRRFEDRLRASRLRESTIQAYLLGSSLFVRWLAGDYSPRGRPERAPSRRVESQS
jgi:hypothetical protein